MATTRSFAYNSGAGITGTSQIGSLAVGSQPISYEGGVTWWNGPDESLGYVIGHTSGTRTSGNGAFTIPSPTVGFWRSPSLTDQSFLDTCNLLFGQGFVNAGSAKTWLNNNGYWTSYAGATSDSIRAALSTSVASYDAATVGNFIKVTASEYSNVILTVAGASGYVNNNTDLTSAYSGWSTGFNVSYNDTTKPLGAIPDSNYIIGYAYSLTSSVAVTTYLRTSTTVNGVHTKLGSNITFTDAGSKTVYFIRKAPPTSTSGKTYVSFYTNGNGLGQVAAKSNYPMYYSSGIDTNTWVLFTGGYPAFQTLATPTKSW